MKKVLVLLAVLTVAGIASADMVVSGADFYPTNGWMNCISGGWGSGWGIDALRVSGTAGNLWIQTNVNASDDNYANWSSGTDLYWLPGAQTLEALNYKELTGLAGTKLTFNFVVGSNNLGGVGGYVTEAFIKTLDPSAGWATTQQVYVSLPVGAGTISLDVVGGAGIVSQYGFRVLGGNDVTGSATAGLGVAIVPEPATMLLLGLGGLFAARKKK